MLLSLRHFHVIFYSFGALRRQFVCLDGLHLHELALEIVCRLPEDPLSRALLARLRLGGLKGFRSLGPHLFFQKFSNVRLAPQSVDCVLVDPVFVVVTLRLTQIDLTRNRLVLLSFCFLSDCVCAGAFSGGCLGGSCIKRSELEGSSLRLVNKGIAGCLARKVTGCICLGLEGSRAQ